MGRVKQLVGRGAGEKSIRKGGNLDGERVSSKGAPAGRKMVLTGEREEKENLTWKESWLGGCRRASTTTKKKRAQHRERPI